MKVAVVKYNAGNIRSVDYALKRLGVEAVITADKEELQSADKVIFPGVGEAETTMNHLMATGLDELIKNLRQPVFGICLGMQLMCRHSEEGEVDCLNIFDVDVKRFVPQKHEDKVPHMGWNTIGKTAHHSLRPWQHLQSGPSAGAASADRKSTRLNSSHVKRSRMPSSA